jgi:antitoxin ChpS
MGCERPQGSVTSTHSPETTLGISFDKLYCNITMHTTNLRKVGGSVMLAVPPALLDILHLNPGSKVGVTVENGRLVVEPRHRPRYTLDELLAHCNPKAARRKQDREWLNSRPTSRELI